MPLVCDQCGHKQFETLDFLRGSPRWGTCIRCRNKMREVEPNVPSVGRLGSLTETQRLLLAVRALDASREILDRIDRRAKDGKPRASMVVDFARATMHGRGLLDEQLADISSRELVMYSQMAQRPESQAVADALLVLASVLRKEKQLDAARTHGLMARCLFARDFDVEVAADFENWVRFFEAEIPKRARFSSGAPKALHRGYEYDLFISHAREDRQTVVQPLADSLHMLGVTMWVDERHLQPGDALQATIDQAMASCRACVAILSSAYLQKQWTAYELLHFLNREEDGVNDLFPVWHGVSRVEVASFSDGLADRLAWDTSRESIPEIACRVADVLARAPGNPTAAE